MAQIDRISPATIHVSPPAPSLRVRHVQKAGCDWYLLFNEEKEPLNVAMQLPGGGEGVVVKPLTGQVELWAPYEVLLAGHELQIVMFQSGIPGKS